MIKYQLKCAGGCDCEFEGWFRDSADFDAQSEAGLLECPQCGSSEVRKAIMAPAVVRSSKRSASRVRDAVETRYASDKTGDKLGDKSVNREADSASTFKREIAEAARRARDYVEKNFDYVGDKFPEEARKIHYGEVEERPIYGEATGKDVKELREEGVAVAPVPGAGGPKGAGSKPKKKLN